MTQIGKAATMYSPDTEGWTVELVRSSGPPPGIGITIVFKDEQQANAFLDDMCPGENVTWDDLPWDDPPKS